MLPQEGIHQIGRALFEQDSRMWRHRRAEAPRHSPSLKSARNFNSNAFTNLKEHGDGAHGLINNGLASTMGTIKLKPLTTT